MPESIDNRDTGCKRNISSRADTYMFTNSSFRLRFNRGPLDQPSLLKATRGHDVCVRSLCLVPRGARLVSWCAALVCFAKCSSGPWSLWCSDDPLHRRDLLFFLPVLLEPCWGPQSCAMRASMDASFHAISQVSQNLQLSDPCKWDP